MQTGSNQSKYLAIKRKRITDMQRVIANLFISKQKHIYIKKLNFQIPITVRFIAASFMHSMHKV